MSEYTLTPKVDSTQEFIEIAFDFSNPLDLVREAISNSFDAKASEITIAFEVEQIRYAHDIISIGKHPKGLMIWNLLWSFLLMTTILCLNY